MMFWRVFTSIIVFLCLSGCSSTPPKQVTNLCHIFDEKGSWYRHARAASKRWGSPIAINMAIMHQESRFVAKAKPPRTKILWIFPGPRKSSAYGYAQAKDETWQWYRKGSGNRGGDRNNFKDAIDFIAWYNLQSHKRAKIDSTDAYRLYLAYHEGQGGYLRRSYKNKAWLKKIAKKVSARASSYQAQLNQCEKRLRKKGRWFF